MISSHPSWTRGTNVPFAQLIRDEREREKSMPTFQIEPRITGRVSSYQTLVFHKRCAKCQKYVLLGFWFVHEQRTDHQDGTSTIQRLYYCRQEPEAGKV